MAADELPQEEEMAEAEGAEVEEAEAEAEGGDEEADGEEQPADEEAGESPPPESPAPDDDDEAPAEEEEADEDNDGGEEAEVEEHLKDAVEGSLRLKRLLSRDSDGADSGPASKRRKPDEGALGSNPVVREKAAMLLQKWNLAQDAVAKHVLENLTLEDIENLQKSNYVPDKFNQRKTPAEMLAGHMLQTREKKIAGASRLDIVQSFRQRWTLDITAEKRLRELNHKDLRYVIGKYDGSTPLEDLIVEAAGEEPAEDGETAQAMPEGPGLKTMSRFNRLELIDPMADCAVFGDANLTFSVNLAKHRKDLGHVGRVIATTFEEIETLKERYKEIESVIKVLEDHHAEVYHGVDCTRIAIDPRFKEMEGTLGAVYYNFPHSGAIQGFFDSHPLVNWRHENLMRLFFRSLRSFVKPGGLVKVSSNSGAVGVRYSYVVDSALENEFLHVETMPFMEWQLHRYGRSYGDRRDTYKRPDAKNNQSYNAQKAQADMVYCFCYAPTGKVLDKQQIRLPPTLKTLSDCRDGPFRNLQGAARAKLAKQLHDRFVREVSGIHVG